MLTKYIAITAAHCLKDRLANRDVLVSGSAFKYLTLKLGSRFILMRETVGAFRQGFQPVRWWRGLQVGLVYICMKLGPFCAGSTCSYNGHDIALVRLSRPMPGMRNLRLNFDSPRVRDRTVMAGTGWI